jgi:hypothetical protein
MAAAHDSFRLWHARCGAIYYNFILILIKSASIHDSDASRERANAPIHDSNGLTRARNRALNSRLRRAHERSTSFPIGTRRRH